MLSLSLSVFTPLLLAMAVQLSAVLFSPESSFQSGNVHPADRSPPSPLGTGSVRSRFERRTPALSRRRQRIQQQVVAAPEEDPRQLGVPTGSFGFTSVCDRFCAFQDKVKFHDVFNFFSNKVNIYWKAVLYMPVFPPLSSPGRVSSNFLWLGPYGMVDVIPEAERRHLAFSETLVGRFRANES